MRFRSAANPWVLLSCAVLAAAGCAAPPAQIVTTGGTHAASNRPTAGVPSFSPVAIRDGVPATVIRVVDGDTLHARVDGVDETVRVIGMDSPESEKPDTPVECFAKEATAAAKGLLRRGDRITLQQDPTQDTRDRFGRRLAHVVLADGTLFAETMIRRGFAVHYVYDGVRSIYADRFDAAQEAAQADQAGLWSPTTCDGDPHLASRLP